MLDDTAQAIFFSGQLSQPPQNIKINCHLGQRPVRQNHSPVVGAGLNAQFAHAGDIAFKSVKTVHKSFEVFLRAVSFPDLANFATN